jgi:5,10-methylenetetrahydromethanopterin reductase
LGVLADKLGYSSVWIPDHLSDLPPAGDKVDPWTIFGAIGYSTNNVRLIPGVTDSIRIHPAKLANVVATLDDFTGGRADVGIGAGERMNTERYGMEWQLDPKLRLKKLREAILLMRGLLNSSIEKPFSFDGDYFKLKNARIDQKPAHRIKFIVGSLGSKESLELTGAVADGWYPVFNTVESFRKRCSIVEEAARRSGRNVE